VFYTCETHYIFTHIFLHESYTFSHWVARERLINYAQNDELLEKNFKKFVCTCYSYHYIMGSTCLLSLDGLITKAI